jgi:hypothetical protein
MTVPDDEQPRQEARPVQRQAQAFSAVGDEDDIPF